MEIEFTLDGQTVRCPQGFTVTGALFHLGHRSVRVTARTAAPRSLFCGIGVCCDCLMQIDGRESVRACTTLVQPGMRVVSGQGAAAVVANQA
ncbi:MAG: (2Fe-2S)-binding protein [Pseudomonadota bacterium]